MTSRPSSQNNRVRLWRLFLIISTWLGLAMLVLGEFNGYGPFGTIPHGSNWIVKNATLLSLGLVSLLVVGTVHCFSNYRRKLLIFGVIALVTSELGTFWMTARSSLIVFPAVATAIIGSALVLLPSRSRPSWLSQALEGDRSEHGDTESTSLCRKSRDPLMPTDTLSTAHQLNTTHQSHHLTTLKFLASYHARLNQETSYKHWLYSFTVPLLSLVGLLLVIGPASLFSTHLLTNGDMAGHLQYTWWSVTHLIPHGHLSGWYPYNYNGIPLYTFYFPLPPLMIAITHLFVSFPLAFKLVAMGSVLFIPLAGWICAWATSEKPAVAAMLSGILFLLLISASYTDWGGTLQTTLQGEYAYAWGLTFGLIALGLGIKAMRRKRGAPLAILFLAATLLCHIVVFAAIAVALVILVLISWASKIATQHLNRAKSIFSQVDIFDQQSPTATLRYAGVIALATLGLTAFFWYPAMHWVNLTSSRGFDSPSLTGWLQRWLHGFNDITLPFAALGVVSLIWRKSALALAGLSLTILAVIAGPSFPSPSTVAPGHTVPIFYYGVAILCAIGVGELIRIAHSALTHSYSVGQTSKTMQYALSTALVLLVFLAPALHYDWPDFGYDHQATTSALNGYTSLPYGAQFTSLINSVKTTAQSHGCGTAAVESSPIDISYSGADMTTTLPYWTNGCVGTMVGLLAESSATALYSEYTSSIMSASPATLALSPGPLRPNYNFPKALVQLQQLGIKYVITYSAESTSQAQDSKLLTKVCVVPKSGAQNPRHPGQWVIFMFKHSATVSALSYSPAVYTGKLTYRTAGINWWSQQSNYSTVLARSGPQSWPRTSSDIKLPHKPLPSQHISAVNVQPDSVSFHVSKLGVPVQVRVSYFPNWTAGTTGQIYQATPNMMIVVPTSHNVKMVYGSAPPVVFATVVSWATLVISIIAWIYFAIRRKLQRGQTTAEVAPE